MHQLNLLNGDCAAEEWRSAGLPGAILVWRENYLQGELPATDEIVAFCRGRAAALQPMASGRSVEDILAELLRMHHELESLTPDDQLVLWFDFCPFDRTMLARILFLLNRLTAPPQVTLIARDVVWVAETFRRHQHAGRRLGAAELQYGAEQWNAYVRGAAPSTLLERLLNCSGRIIK